VTAGAAAPAPGLPWRRALVRAAAMVWLPTLAPVVTGMLSGCGHCATTYWLSLPTVPGLLAPVLLQLDDARAGQLLAPVERARVHLDQRPVARAPSPARQHLGWA
jgi:hypothetical protein